MHSQCIPGHFFSPSSDGVGTKYIFYINDIDYVDIRTDAGTVLVFLVVVVVF